MLGYFSTSNGPQTLVKNGSTSVIYKNNMQKSMDQIKELLLSDSETQTAQKRMIVLKMKSQKLPKRI